MPHQIMGYDRVITMFSPAGELLQVEYAAKTVKRGSSAIGMVCRDGVIFVADKRLIEKLILAESVEKIYKIDDHVGATASGILSDARVLIERAQIKAQQHKITYDTPVDIITLVKDVSSLMQICTQSAGLRPFGVGLIIGGVDDSPKIFQTDPTGIFYQYKAAVIGEKEKEIKEIIEKEYKDDMTINEGLKLCIYALQKALGKEFFIERIDAAKVSSVDKKFVKLTKEEILKIFKEIKKK